MPKKKEREKERKQSRHRRINENENDSPPLRPPEHSYHESSTPSRRVPSSTSKKDDDDDAAAARTGPRVSPGTLPVVGKGYSRRPSGRIGDTHKRHRVGVKDRDFSRPPKNHNSGQFVALHQSCHPPTHDTTVLKPPSSSHHGKSSKVG